MSYNTPDLLIAMWCMTLIIKGNLWANRLSNQLIPLIGLSLMEQTMKMALQELTK
jgi:hypothetical protein